MNLQKNLFYQKLMDLELKEDYEVRLPLRPEMDLIPTFKKIDNVYHMLVGDKHIILSESAARKTRANLDRELGKD